MEKRDPSDLRGKRALAVSAETTDLLANKGSGDRRDHLAARETKGTLARTDPRVPMVLQAQLALQGREASWVFRVKEESAGCRDFLDRRAHQENRERRDRPERKDRRDLSASPVPTGLAVIRVPTATPDPTASPAKRVSLARGEIEATPARRACSVLRGFPAPQVPSAPRAAREEEETSAPEDPAGHLVQLGRED